MTNSIEDTLKTKSSEKKEEIQINPKEISSEIASLCNRVSALGDLYLSLFGATVSGFLLYNDHKIAATSLYAVSSVFLVNSIIDLYSGKHNLLFNEIQSKFRRQK